MKGIRTREIKIDNWPGNSQGFSLLVILMAMVIAGILLQTLTMAIQSEIKTARNIKLRGEINDIERYIGVARDCVATNTPINCPTVGAVMSINKKDNTEIITKGPSYTKVGDFFVRAKCQLQVDPLNAAIILERNFGLEYALAGASTLIWEPMAIKAEHICN